MPPTLRRHPSVLAHIHQQIAQASVLVEKADMSTVGWAQAVTILTKLEGDQSRRKTLLRIRGRMASGSS
jgi:hypothetical protein